MSDEQAQQSGHGGARPGSGQPRKMDDPIRTTITLEREDLEALRERFGREWQGFLREMIGQALLRMAIGEALDEIGIDNH
jgi:hypothetical protein